MARCAGRLNPTRNGWETDWASEVRENSTMGSQPLRQRRPRQALAPHVGWATQAAQ
ncbi:hypothetical protein F442_13808, partial [Phytophthora nicotianae P10297]